MRGALKKSGLSLWDDGPDFFNKNWLLKTEKAPAADSAAGAWGCYLAADWIQAVNDPGAGGAGSGRCRPSKSCRPR